MGGAPGKRGQLGVPVGCPLTAREFEAIYWAEQGLRPKGIAERVGISTSQAKYRLFHAQQRLGEHTRLGGVEAFRAHGWHEPPLSPAIKLYLQAFDRFLAAVRRPRDKQRALAEMHYLMPALFIEVQLPAPTVDRGRRDDVRDAQDGLRAMFDLLLED